MKVTLDDNPRPTERDRPSPGPEVVRSGIEKQKALNWLLLVVAFSMIALGVATVVPPLLSERLASAWPWPKPQMALIVVLCLALVVLTGLSHQKRYIALLKSQFERAQQEEAARSRKNAQRMFALLSMSRVLGLSSDLQKVFDSVVETCVDAFGCHLASLMIFDRETQELVVRAAAGESVPMSMMGVRLPLGEGIAGWAAKRGQALLIGSDFDLSKHPGLELKNASLTSAMVVPIVLRDELVGVLNVSTRSRKTVYDEDDLRALQIFAESVGACIRHAEQASWMRQTIRTLQEALKTQRNQPTAESTVSAGPARRRNTERI